MCASFSSFDVKRFHRGLRSLRRNAHIRTTTPTTKSLFTLFFSFRWFCPTNGDLIIQLFIEYMSAEISFLPHLVSFFLSLESCLLRFDFIWLVLRLSDHHHHHPIFSPRFHFFSFRLWLGKPSFRSRIYSHPPPPKRKKDSIAENKIEKLPLGG